MNTTRAPLSAVPRGCLLLIFAALVLGVIALLWVCWLMPRAVTTLNVRQNHLKVVFVDEAGSAMTNAAVQFSLLQEVPVIPVPYGGTRWIEDSRTAFSNGKGEAEITWPNMKLNARTVSVAGVSYPIEPGYSLGGSVVAPTPDGRSTWDVGTDYTARIVVDRVRHSAAVH
jgi:hypothetical protein